MYCILDHTYENDIVRLREVYQKGAEEEETVYPFWKDLLDLSRGISILQIT